MCARGARRGGRALRVHPRAGRAAHRPCAATAGTVAATSTACAGRKGGWRRERGARGGAGLTRGGPARTAAAHVPARGKQQTADASGAPAGPPRPPCLRGRRQPAIWASVQGGGRPRLGGAVAGGVARGIGRRSNGTAESSGDELGARSRAPHTGRPAPPKLRRQCREWVATLFGHAPGGRRRGEGVGRGGLRAGPRNLVRDAAEAFSRVRGNRGARARAQSAVPSPPPPPPPLFFCFRGRPRDRILQNTQHILAPHSRRPRPPAAGGGGWSPSLFARIFFVSRRGRPAPGVSTTLPLFHPDRRGGHAHSCFPTVEPALHAPWLTAT
jgi:hypothetical protein